MKRKIACISEHASPLATLGGVDNGGQNVYVGELARHLVALDYRVDIFARWDDTRLPRVVSWIPGVRVIHMKAGPIRQVPKENLLPYMDEFTQDMLAFMLAEPQPYVLMHANFWMSAMVAADIKEYLSIPYVVTFHALGRVRRIHQGDDDKFPAIREDIERRVVRDCDHIIAECPQDQEDLITHYDAPPEKITIIPCGFNPHEFYPLDRLLARMMLNFESGEYILLQLGRLVPRKGIDNVIRALAKVQPLDLPVRLVVVGGEGDGVGDDPEMNRLRELANTLGVSERVTFAGRQKRDMLKYYYAAADIFITTPWYEPFGITPLEAMACGTPVIGAAVGGIQYSVEEGKTGLLVPPNDADALADKIYDLLTDATRRTKMKRQAIRRVNALFTWSKVSEQVAGLYERVLLSRQASVYDDDQEFSFIGNAFDQAVETLIKSKDLLSFPMREAARVLTNCFRHNRKVLVCGNGGSAAESQHLVAELLGRFELAERQALPALALTADTTFLTAWSNDIGFEEVFARQVEALGQKGDVLVCFSTSGQSANVIQAMKAAHRKQMTCIALSGKGGGETALYAHVNLVVPSYNTQRIQELHLHVLHTLCALVEINLFSNSKRLQKRSSVVESGVFDESLNTLTLMMQGLYTPPPGQDA